MEFRRVLFRSALTWKQAGGDRLTVTVPVPPAAPGALTLLVHPKGGGEAVRVALATTTEQLRLARLTLHAGDSEADLTGTGLDKVTGVSPRSEERRVVKEGVSTFRFRWSAYN